MCCCCFSHPLLSVSSVNGRVPLSDGTRANHAKLWGRAGGGRVSRRRGSAAGVEWRRGWGGRGGRGWDGAGGRGGEQWRVLLPATEPGAWTARGGQRWGRPLPHWAAAAGAAQDRGEFCLAIHDSASPLSKAQWDTACHATLPSQSLSVCPVSCRWWGSTFLKLHPQTVMKRRTLRGQLPRGAEPPSLWTQVRPLCGLPYTSTQQQLTHIFEVPPVSWDHFLSLQTMWSWWRGWWQL